MILLDTNVTSEFMTPSPNDRVVQWLDLQPVSSIWTTSINVYEIRAGLLAMPAGRRRSALEARLEQLLQVLLQGRILPFDSESALRAAELSAERRKRGREIDARDTMIAGIVLANHATLATRNVKHFEDIAESVVNPWEKR
jgi:toxin FitB